LSSWNVNIRSGKTSRLELFDLPKRNYEMCKVLK
jgi:hypothetical protein